MSPSLPSAVLPTSTCFTGNRKEILGILSVVGGDLQGPLEALFASYVIHRWLCQKKLP